MLLCHKFYNGKQQGREQGMGLSHNHMTAAQLRVGHGTWRSRGYKLAVVLGDKIPSEERKRPHRTFTDKEWFKQIQQTDGSKAELQDKRFRFWHDEKRFKGTGENSLAQRALIAAGGLRMGGRAKFSPGPPGPLGSQRKSEWDILWSPATTSHKALEGGLEDGQLCSSVPGTQSICKKKKLAETLVSAFGETAWDITPRTYSLPGQVKQWREWMQDNRGKKHLWMLKTAQHLGKGLKLVPYQKAVKEMLVQYESSEEAKKIGKAKQVRPFVVAQQYIDDPLLVNNRKFGIRVWVVITSIDPLRVYLHQGGLVLFSTDDYDNGNIKQVEGQISGGHVTNYAQNKDGLVWNLKQLQQYLGNERFSVMYNQILKCTAMTYAAALPAMKKECSRLKLPQGSFFELMGLDFLVDEGLKPWLLEVNSTPSLAVEHEDDLVESMIYNEKNSMVVDMFKLLQVPDRFHARWQKLQLQNLIRPRKAGSAETSLTTSKDNGQCSSALIDKRNPENESILHEFMSDSQACYLQVLVESEIELQIRSGFQSLLPFMPWDAESEGWNIPWSEGDRILRSWLLKKEALEPSNIKI